MKIRVARTAGFCFGVRKAIDLVLDAARELPAAPARADGCAGSHDRAGDGGEDACLCTLGPLIHNDQALEALRVSGVRAVKDLGEVTGGTVVIRAHGAGPGVRDEIRARDLRIIDATCPRVVRCQRAVERAASEGRQILIAGDADHAEVAALVDFAQRHRKEPDDEPLIVNTVELAETVELRPPVTLVAQTTFSSRTYGEIAAALRRRLAGEGGGEGALEVVRSLCRSTEERQRETEELAREVDAVVVVGGRHSANTRRLAEVASRAAPRSFSEGGRVFHVETAEELVPAEFEGLSVVGVTAGASTPAWVTESVVERLVEIGSPVRRLLRRIAAALLGSNLLLAAGAASLTYSAIGAAGIAPGRGFGELSRAATPSVAPFGALLPVLFLAFAYVFFAYAANRAREERRTDLAPILSVHSPAHIRFFDRHTGAILGAAWVLAASGAALGFWMGTAVGLAFSGAVLFAALYSVRLLRRSSLRDIPGSKDFFVALAFAFVAVAVPGLLSGAGGTESTVIAAVSVFLLGFSAATALELGDVHSDRLMGRESVAVLLGYRRSRVLVAGAAALVLAATAVPAALGRMGPAGYGLAAAGGGVFLTMMKRRTPGDSLLQAFTIQTSLLAAGPVAWLATFWQQG